MSRLSRVSLLAIVALARGAAADGPAAEPQRGILQRHEQSGVPDKEIVLGVASLPPGTAIGFHTHPGDEIGFVKKGSLLLKTRGQPDRLLKTGDSFFSPRGVVHSLVAPPDGDGGVVVSTWVVDKALPLATPVP
ncbi:MAG: cupin domain-containing protein [Steroidobacteraceae bacterium]